MSPERWREITDLFHAALARPADERARFLDGACPSDAALRAEVEAMLAVHGSDAGQVPILALPDDRIELQAGRTIGPYVIEKLIGAGGMGRVYRGHDSRIGRAVAIKVLPAAYAADAGRLRRFEQEARTSGALTHPNVLTLYDVGTADGRPYLVTELVDGETLRERLGRGTLSAARACEVAANIARGLAAAHAKGIVHRDLKPENVMLTRDGRVKILDFGIAKLRGSDDVRPASVVSAPGTEPGVVVGTAGYMAPEQIRGTETDGRADVFALGAILYESLSGRRAFDGDARADVLHASLNLDPLIDTGIFSQWPPAVLRTVRRCLEKDPEARFQSAGDLAFALETITDQSLPAPTPVKAAGRRWIAPLLIAMALLGAAVASYAAWTRWRAPAADTTRELARFTLPLPPRTRFAGMPAISPDGTTIAYTASEGLVESERIYVRRIDQLTAAALPGTDVGRWPFFSPDGTSVAFWSANTLKRTRVDATASPTVITPVESFLGGVWLPDGTVVFGSRAGLQQVAADGGTPRILIATDPAASDLDHRAPEVLPGGGTVLFTVRMGQNRFRIDAVTVASGARRTLIANGFDAHYMPTGHLVYGSGSALLAVRFDAARLEVSGPPVRLVEGLLTDQGGGSGRYALSRTGTLVFMPAPPPPRRRLAWVDRTGATTPLPLEPRAFFTPRLSPDGLQIAVVVWDSDGGQIWIHRPDRGTSTRLTNEGNNWSPVWSRDGSYLLYTSEQDGRWSLMRLAVEGNLAPEVLLTSDDSEILPGALAGDSLVFISRSPTGDTELRTLELSSRRVRVLEGLTAAVAMPVLSPDGRWLGVTGWPGPRPSIFVGRFGEAGPLRLLEEGAGYTVWSRSGDRLYFRTRRGATGNESTDGIFELPFDPTLGVATGPARQLFRKSFTDWLGVPGFDVAADGRFLLVLSDERESIPSDLHVILHLDDELRRRTLLGDGRTGSERGQP